MALILEILSFLNGTPPPYSRTADLNADGIVTVADLLIALSIF